MNLHNTMFKAYEPSEKDKSFLDEMEKYSEQIKSKDMLKTNYGNFPNNDEIDFNHRQLATYHNEDAILNKSYEGSERDDDIEDIDELHEDTSRV
jgi:hypothetical protein